jgi:hypothetical protein
MHITTMVPNQALTGSTDCLVFQSPDSGQEFADWDLVVNS